MAQMFLIHQLLAEAIRKERGAYQLYELLAAQAEDIAARTLLEALAADERRHEKLLTELSVDGLLARKIPPVEDLRIIDFLKEVKLAPNSSFQEVLIFAAKQEDTSWKTYQALAESAKDGNLETLLDRLADEEKNHKNRLEKLYDDVIYREN